MLTPEKIQSNYAEFFEIIETHISSPRKEKLLDLYNSLEEILILAPASSKASFHNAFAGGYVDHIIRVVNAGFLVSETWTKMGCPTTFTKEELVFACLNHDLGKLGMDGKPRYIPNDSEWHVKNQGANYKPNAELPFLPVQDNSLYLLQQHGIQLTVNEYIAIKIHDGLYDDGNKAFYLSSMNESKLRTDLPFVVHQADMIASRFEWEREWLDKINNPQAKSAIKPKTQVPFKAAQDMQKLRAAGSTNAALLDVLKNL